MSHKKSGSTKKNDSIPIEKNTVSKGIKFLCIMSFLGFMYYLVQDTSQYMAYSNFEDLKKSANQEAYEIMETKLSKIEATGIDVSSEGLLYISKLFIFLSIIDVLVMVGTALMYFQIRKGYYIYVIFQLTYVLLPVVFFKEHTFSIVEKGILIIPLLYVALFTTQLKNLTR